MRKPAIFLAVILPLQVAGWSAITLLAPIAYARVRGVACDGLGALPKAAGFLIVLPSLFLWIPLSLLVANLVLRAVPALRRIADDHARAAGTPGFRGSQRDLLVASACLAALCVPLIAIGFSA